MSKPAARIGDMTSHGGVIVVGQPNVLIGGMPAARATDMHTCPMFNGPQPHVGGPVAMGSTGVLIGGMPAARMGDMAICAGPPDPIVMGCFTVLIGETMPGGGGGGAGAGAPGAAGANASAAAAQMGSPESTTKEEHWVEFEFVDAAGLPVSGVRYAFEDPEGRVSEGHLRLDGTIRRDALNDGQCEVVLKDVYGAEWGKKEARPDEKVKFSAKVDGFEAGTPATVQVCKRDIKGADAIVEEINTKVQGSEVKGEWAYVYPEEGASEGFSAPRYYFEVNIESCRARSGLLKYKDWVEIELRDENDEPMKGAKYVLHLSNGTVRTGTLDNQGKAKEENLPAQSHKVRFPKLQQ